MHSGFRERPEFYRLLGEQGHAFFTDEYFTGIPASTPYDFLFITPTVGILTYVWMGISTAYGMEFAFFEGADVSAQGAPVSLVNRNRQSAKTSPTAFFQGPTVTTPGTQLLHRIFEDGGTQGQTVLPLPDASSDGPYLLAAATNYLLRFIPATTTNTTNYHFEFSHYTALSIG